MALTKEQMAQIVTTHGRDAQDTGSSEVQIAALTQRIAQLTEHMKQNHKDFATRLGLLKLVARRRKLLKYLQRTAVQRYNKIKETLGLK